jgi:NRAMP (natural resistance-associated macrophage protein)-like metal ion transporter
VVTSPRSRDGDHSHNPVVRYFKLLGPGLVTGAADDDPSGITTYSVTGAALGYTLLWSAVVTFPLAAAIQLTCARIGLVTGRGLAGAVRRHYPRPLLYLACLLLLAANVFNIAADLAGMASAAELLTGLPSLAWTLTFAVALVLGTVFLRYATLARFLKWLTAVLFAYVAAAILARPDWKQALWATVVPRLRLERSSITTLVGVLGTTISPYLFFWQASQEVEEERARGRRSVTARRGATPDELRDARIDVASGMGVSTVVMYFIILTAGATLHRAGLREVETARQAAEALRPLAGDAAYLLFALGLIGSGLLAIPILAGSASFAVAEVFGWRAGLDLRPGPGHRFYLVFAGAVAVGLALDLIHASPIRMMFLSAVVNGVLAPPLLILVVLVGSNRRIMGTHASSPALAALGWLAVVVMSAATLALLVIALV